MKLLIATNNPGKFNEIASFLKDFNINAISLSELNIIDEVEENGLTFKENALIKAKFYTKLSNLPTIGDDGGLEIKALNNEPGVKSRRWKGYRMSDQEMIDYTLKRLADIPKKNRQCQMRVALALVFPDGQEYTAEDSIRGFITEEQKTPIIAGYPFRSIFYIPEFKKLLSELTEQEHQKINHRLKALKKLLPRLQ